MGLPKGYVLFFTMLRKQFIEPGTAQSIEMVFPILLPQKARRDMRTTQFRKKAIKIRQRHTFGSRSFLFWIERGNKINMRNRFGQRPRKFGRRKAVQGIEDAAFGDLKCIGDALIAEAAAEVQSKDIQDLSHG
jgi:hypothetical protein